MVNTIKPPSDSVNSLLFKTLLLRLKIFVAGLWLRPFMSQKINHVDIRADISFLYGRRSIWFHPLIIAISREKRCTVRQFNFPVRNEYVFLLRNGHWLLMTQCSNQFLLMLLFKGPVRITFVWQKKTRAWSTDACLTTSLSVAGQDSLRLELYLSCAGIIMPDRATLKQY